jgi:DNA (cytosine-5)-methyltransferase 1
VGFVEIDPYCQELLRERFGTGIPVFGDVREFDPSQIPGEIDCIIGGFPCTNISIAGLGLGIEGEFSALWAEFIRCICLARPGHALVENVREIKNRGLGVVLGTLAFGGYDSEWDCISTLALGCFYYDHEANLWRYQNRDRILTHGSLPDTDRERLWFQQDAELGCKGSPFITDYGEDECLADTVCDGCDGEGLSVCEGGPFEAVSMPAGGCEVGSLEDSGRQLWEEGPEESRMLSGLSQDKQAPDNAERPDQARDKVRVKGVGQADAHSIDADMGRSDTGEILGQGFQKAEVFGGQDIGIFERARREHRLERFRDSAFECWAAEPCVRRIPARTPDWMDQIRLCGNANPPQLFQYLGELVLEDARRRGLI